MKYCLAHQGEREQELSPTELNTPAFSFTQRKTELASSIFF